MNISRTPCPTRPNGIAGRANGRWASERKKALPFERNSIFVTRCAQWEEDGGAQCILRSEATRNLLFRAWIIAEKGVMLMLSEKFMRRALSVS